ncbi:MAG: E3 binding domain-containing protein, partial [Candidatus Riflebacteria bacterium]|nr:E3 binding domain-containing protein [Candidatus Riflebacteria bacterium]
MIVEIKVPSVGESITQGLIVEWLKQPGQAVRADEPVAVLETDKVTVEIPSPVAGILGPPLRSKGQTVSIGETIGTVDTEPAPAGPEAARSGPAGTGPSSGPPDLETPRPGSDEAAEPGRRGRAVPPPGPAVRRLIDESKISLDEVQGTGKGGRVLKEDILRHLSTGSRTSEESPPAPAPAPAAAVAPPGSPRPSSPPARHDRVEERVAMTPIRQRIAQRLLQVCQTAAMVTTFNQVDLSRVMDLRDRYRKAFEAKYSVKLG